MLLTPALHRSKHLSPTGQLANVVPAAASLKSGKDSFTSSKIDLQEKASEPAETTTQQPEHAEVRFSCGFPWRDSTQAQAKKALANGDISRFNTLKQSLDQAKKTLNLGGYSLRAKNLARVNFRHVNLRNADLQGAYLAGADLQNANLRNAKLQNANLEYANLEEANLQNAHLQNAKLGNANLNSVNLQSADLQSADLQDAKFQKANFVNANLSDVTNLCSADLKEAMVNDYTKLDWEKVTHQQLRRAPVWPYTPSRFLG